MAKEKAAEHFARTGDDRNGEIAAHRQMAFGHAMIGRALAIARIAQNIVGAHRPAAAERRFEDRGVARHRKFLEGAARRARERVERVGFAAFLDDVVEEGAELRVAQLDAGIGDQLNQPFKIMFGRDRDAGTVEHLERARFFPHLADPGFERFVEREQPRFQRLALGDVEERAPQQSGESPSIRPLPAIQCRLPSGCLTRNSTLKLPVCGAFSKAAWIFGTSSTKMTCSQVANDRSALRGSMPNRTAACGLQSQLPVARSISKVPIPLAASASRRRSSDAARVASSPFVSCSLSCMQPLRSRFRNRMALASLIARSLPSAICLGR